MKLYQVTVLYTSWIWKNYIVRSFLVAEISLRENHEKYHFISPTQPCFYRFSHSHISTTRNAIPLKLGHIVVVYTSRTWKNSSARSFLVTEICLWENHEKFHCMKNWTTVIFTDFHRHLSRHPATGFQWNSVRLLYFIVVQRGKITPSDLF